MTPEFVRLNKLTYSTGKKEYFITLKIGRDTHNIRINQSEAKELIKEAALLPSMPIKHPYWFIIKYYSND